MAIVKLNAPSNGISVGGKAAALRRLLLNDYSVPAGFVVTSLDDLSNSKQVLREFDSLGSPKVAVRSSSTVEDGHNESWAGQFESFLDVTRDDLLKKIEECFASAYSERAQQYQSGNKDLNMSVIVQQMIPAKTAGVAFSMHPVTHNLQQIVIEAVNGTGEKLVSGLVTPSTYILDKETLSIAESTLEDAELDGKSLRELGEMVRKVENEFSYPVDIEWAVFKKKLWLLQARPITT